MSSKRSEALLRGLSLALLFDWTSTFSLVFGGCCSNALTLERITQTHASAGTLLTFAQFVVISIHGLPKFITTIRGPLGMPIPWLKRRRIPLTPYLIQVVLFYVISLLNNKAFAFRIPMPVHIIFRSGGLVISMVMGWLISGRRYVWVHFVLPTASFTRTRRYTITQVLSVLLVTAGVIVASLSASTVKSRKPPSVNVSSGDVKSTTEPSSSGLQMYLTGIGILTLALVLSGFLGIVQDRTYSHYAAPKTTSQPSSSSTKSESITPPTPQQPKDTRPSTWEESMFYLHFLSLPMFLFVRNDITSQTQSILRISSSSPSLAQSLSSSSLLSSLTSPKSSPLSFSSSSFPGPGSPLLPPLSPPLPLPMTSKTAYVLHTTLTFLLPYLNSIPSALPLLVLNTLTQLLCTAGVNRLTTRVNNLTVTLILVVRKAVSLILSVVLFRMGGKGDGGEGAGGEEEDVAVWMMWLGAGLVGLGTVGYAVGGKRKPEVKDKKE
ncbi:UAA transporter [Stereum hirsutum FP-91666 SS1]|uniref:UAA transporter n=1 Tax=Stereum hirsutum (strain FP-91666) TaxID=721885 RepID=UPI0004449E49|nr:UAA transporter [Stereum hirsutum FP-91666 SS1]EIM85496.1 UAA transporter [Stereum hirsutum FP-91666 SS1]